MSAGFACTYCPANRFPNRTALNAHEEQHALDDLAAHPRAPLDVLRAALLWAEDDGLFEAFGAAERALLDMAALLPSTGNGALCALKGQNDLAHVHASLSRDSGTLTVLFNFRRGGTVCGKWRLPARFAVKPINSLQKDAA